MGNSFASNRNIKVGSNLTMKFQKRDIKDKSLGKTKCCEVKYIIENDLLKKINFSSTLPLSDNLTYERRGFFKETNFFFHGVGRGLIVVEQNSMQRGMNPYKVTVEHYYAVPNENDFSGNKIDIGLSMVVNISISNNILFVSAEGPVQHPSSTLLRMIKENVIYLEK